MKKLLLRSFNNVQERNTACICGHCGKGVALDVFALYYHMEDAFFLDGRKSGEKAVNDFLTGQCPFCGKPIIYNCKDQNSLPFVRQFEDVPHLPAEIESLYNECRDAYSVNAFTCCVISGRTLMMNVAVNQGAEEKDKNFVYYVDYLVDNCLPKSSSKPWVDKIRALGNSSAHKFVIATKEQAEQSLKFLTAILKNIYEFPNSI